MDNEAVFIPDDCKKLHIVLDIQTDFLTTYHIVCYLPHARLTSELVNPSREQLQALADQLKDWTQVPLPRELAEIELAPDNIREYTR